MTSSERLFQLLDNKGIKQKEIADLLNINKSVVANWKKRNCTPPADYLPIICNLIDCSLEYLLTGSEDNNTLSKKEKELINYYRKSNNIGKEKILESAIDQATLHPQIEGKVIESKIG